MSAHTIPVIDQGMVEFHARVLRESRGVVTSLEWLDQAQYAEAQGFPLAAEAFRSTALLVAQQEINDLDARELLKRLVG